MRIGFVSHSGQMGGAERALVEAILGLRGHGVEARVVVPRSGQLAEALRAHHIPYTVVPYTWWMGRRSGLWKRLAKALINAAAILPLALRLRAWRCQAVYSNSVTIGVGAAAAFLLRLPHVWHVHEFGLEHHELEFELGESFAHALIGRSRVCIVPSRAVAEKYESVVPAGQVTVLYQAVEVVRLPAAQRRTPGRRFRCVVVGTLHPAKGQDDAIRAVARLIRAGRKIQLLLVGSGNAADTAEIRRLIAECGLERAVRCLGHRRDAVAIIEVSDVVLVCSRFEAFGRATVEAMLCEKPVIGARSGATVELVQDGFNGLLYSPTADQELADRIEYLMDRPAEARRLGVNGRKWASVAFSRDRYGKELHSLVSSTVPRV